MSDTDSSEYGTSNRELFQAIRESSIDDEMADILENLILHAGHITIRALFSSSHEEIGEAASKAIRAAKRIGFLDLDNKLCCVPSTPGGGATCKATRRGHTA